MRDFLEDALEHRDDGYGRAQKRHASAQLPKRFYKQASAGDGRRRPHRAARRPPDPDARPRAGARARKPRIAEIMAAEWNAQGEEIDPETMPVVRLVNAALEGGEAVLPDFRAEVLKYAGTDLLFYRADSPAELRDEQERHWDPILTALARHFGVGFETTQRHRPCRPAGADARGARRDALDDERPVLAPPR